MFDLQRDERLAIIRGLPKVELHRHLEGSVRLSTLLESIRKSNLDVPLSWLESNENPIHRNRQEIGDFEKVLEKLRLACFGSYSRIERIAQETIIDAASEGIVHLELTFDPQKLIFRNGLQLLGVMEAVAEAGCEAAQECGIGVRLIVSFSREYFDEQIWKQAIDLAARLSPLGLAGIDLPEDERHRMYNEYGKIVNRANDTGVLGVAVHMNMCSDAHQVVLMVDGLGAHRIGHGLPGSEDEQVVRFLVNRNAALVLCPISDYQNGLVDDVQSHPLPRLDQAGVRVTLNANHPTIQNSTINDEYDLAITRWGYELDDLLRLERNAVYSCFLTEKERQSLLDRIEKGYEECRDQGLF